MLGAITTSLTVRPAFVGGGFTGQARVFSSVAIGATPVVARIFPLMAYNTITTQLAEDALAASDYVDGALGLAPGTSVTMQEIGTTAVSGMFSMLWAEIPV